MFKIFQPGATALVLASFIGGAAFAGPFTDAETQLRAAYNDYRTALFQSNAGKADAVDAALIRAQEKWAALGAEWAANTPPQYQDDPELPATMAKVGTLLAEAQAIASKGDLAEAHEVLEQVRDQIWDMHLRNGIIGFSDRMNAYHLEMEDILAVNPATLDAAGRATLQGQAAVLSYLAAQLIAHPAPEAADPAYAPLAQAMYDATLALEQATQDPDPEALKAALGQLKPAYAKFFAKFG